MGSGACLGKCCTSNYNRAPEFEVHYFLFTHNLRKSGKNQKETKQSSVMQYVLRVHPPGKKKGKEKEEKEEKG